MNSNFRLCPVDVLVNINSGDDPWAIIRRWVSGEYSHVFVYLGRLFIDIGGEAFPKGINVPMLFESNGRGCCLRLLSERYSEEVVVLRLISEHDRGRIPYVLQAAIELASDDQAYYDYMCIVKYILPRLICEKLGLPMPLKYHRDPWHVCSEAIFEVFYRAKLVNILRPYCVPPLPGDFVTDSLLLEEVNRGKLSPEWV